MAGICAARESTREGLPLPLVLGFILDAPCASNPRTTEHNCLADSAPDNRFTAIPPLVDGKCIL